MGRKKKEHDIYRKPAEKVDAANYPEAIDKAIAEHLKSDRKDLKPNLAFTSIWKYHDESISVGLYADEDRHIASYKYLLGKNGKYRKQKSMNEREHEREIRDPEEKIEWTPEQELIAKVLEDEYGFGKVRGVWRPFIGNGSHNAPDIEKVSHVLRIHVLHYLFYSPVYKMFTIALKHDEPKGEAGGGYRYYTTMSVPKLIYKEDDARDFLTGLLGKDLKKRLMPYPM